ncbi:MAG: type II secretion system F family protein [Phycisphaerales bacterium]
MFITLILIALVLYMYVGYKAPRFAIISVPFVAGGTFIFWASMEEFEPAVISLLMFPCTLIAILFAKNEAGEILWPKEWARMILFVLGTILGFVGLVIVSGPIGFVVGGGFAGLMLGSCIGAAATQRNATVAYVISTIDASMKQNLPLAMALQSASENLKFQHTRIMQKISKWLVQGFPLSEAIKRGFRNCPAKIAALIAAGERIGQVPQVVGSIERDLLEKATDSRRIRPVYPATYFIVMFICISMLVMGLMIGVIPKFSTVIKDMAGKELPKSTMLLMNISDAIAFRYGWLTLTIIGILFILSLIYIKIKYRPRRPERPRLFSRIGDFIKWHTPIVRWFENNNSTLQVVEVLRISLNSGNTINHAIRNTLGLDVNCQYRKKLEKWLKMVEAGERPGDALRRCGLVKSMSLAFEQKSNPENTLSVLDMLESVYRTNYNFKINAAKFVLLPCTTIMLGSMVAFVAYAIFAAIVEIITVCSNLI